MRQRAQADLETALERRRRVAEQRAGELLATLRLAEDQLALLLRKPARVHRNLVERHLHQTRFAGRPAPERRMAEHDVFAQSRLVKHHGEAGEREAFFVAAPRDRLAIGAAFAGAAHQALRGLAHHARDLGETQQRRFSRLDAHPGSAHARELGRAAARRIVCAHRDELAARMDRIVPALRHWFVGVRRAARMTVLDGECQDELRERCRQGARD